MGDAAPQAEDIEQALSYLRVLCGDEFMIGHDEQGYWATRIGHVGASSAVTPDKLGELMNGAGQ
jgi:hypothetical protein